jgi:hypothetical protein
MGLTAGVTGGQWMLTPPRHLIPPLVNPRVSLFIPPFSIVVYLRLITTLFERSIIIP